MSNIPSGYKQTEVGVIPEDWEIKEVRNIADNNKIPSGIYKDKNLYGKGTKIIKLGDVFGCDYFIPEIAQKVQLTKKELLAYQVKINDIFIALASVKLEGVGKVMLVNSLDEETAYDHNVALIRVIDSFNPKYICNLFKSNVVRNQIASQATQVGTTFLKSSTILKFKIPVPPTKAEQAAIATALSDVDALISALNSEIAKKYLIKQGAMQELLSGKKRLAGFSDEWEVKKLGDVTEIDSDNLSSSTSPEYIFNYISLEDVDFGRLKNTTELQFKNSPSRARRKIKKGDVLVSTVRPNLKSHLIIKDEVNDWICSTGFSVIRCSHINPYYIFNHFFSSIINSQIETIITGSNYPAINSTDIKNLLIPLPPTKEEQTAIAQILSDMDNDIQTLETERNKTLAIKQGMMQELLTGKTRLLT
jgi:type I restriction enzyme S subunit